MKMEAGKERGIERMVFDDLMRRGAGRNVKERQRTGAVQDAGAAFGAGWRNRVDLHFQINRGQERSATS